MYLITPQFFLFSFPALKKKISEVYTLIYKKNDSRPKECGYRKLRKKINKQKIDFTDK